MFFSSQQTIAGVPPTLFGHCSILITSRCSHVHLVYPAWCFPCCCSRPRRIFRSCRSRSWQLWRWTFWFNGNAWVCSTRWNRNLSCDCKLILSYSGYGLLPDNIDNNIMYRYMTRGMGLNPFYSYSMQRVSSFLFA